MNWDLPKLHAARRHERSIFERRCEAIKVYLNTLSNNTVINLFMAILTKEQARDITRDENLEVPKH